MRAIGSPLPRFELPDPQGRSHTPASLSGERGLLVAFICNHCPFVVHIADELGRIGHEYMPQGIGCVAINSNDAANFPDDAPEKMPAFAAHHGIEMPYLIDESQQIARAFDAACTPDWFLFDRDGALVYRGQLDESRPDNGVPVTGRDLRAAMDAILAGAPVPTHQVPSLGCNIKWKSCDCCCDQ